MAYKLLHSVGLPDSLVLLVESVDTVNHLLEQLDLAVAQPVLVGDVVGDPGLAAGLAPGDPGLQVELLAPGRQHLGAQLGPAREVNVDRGPHACAQVGGAGVDVAISRIKHEVMTRLLLDRVLHSLAVLQHPEVVAVLENHRQGLVTLIVPVLMMFSLLHLTDAAHDPTLLHPLHIGLELPLQPLDLIIHVVKVLPGELMLHGRLSLVAGALVHVGLDDALLVLAQSSQLFQLDLDSFSDLEARSLSRFGLEWSYWITSTYSTLSFEAGNHVFKLQVSSVWH